LFEIRLLILLYIHLFSWNRSKSLSGMESDGTNVWGHVNTNLILGHASLGVGVPHHDDIFLEINLGSSVFNSSGSIWAWDDFQISTSVVEISGVEHSGSVSSLSGEVVLDGEGSSKEESKDNKESHFLNLNQLQKVLSHNFMVSKRYNRFSCEESCEYEYFSMSATSLRKAHFNSR
jgi:hypothetical protein